MPGYGWAKEKDGRGEGAAGRWWLQQLSVMAAVAANEVLKKKNVKNIQIACAV